MKKHARYAGFLLAVAAAALNLRRSAVSLGVVRQASSARKPASSASVGRQTGNATLPVGAAPAANAGAAGRSVGGTVFVPEPAFRPPCESFSACLLWMDDSNRLVEWIAYHYHVLPLRHLVVFRDPRSTQNLTSVLARWQGLIDIQVWHDVYPLMPPKKQLRYRMKQHILNVTRASLQRRASLAYDIHLLHQEEFYRACGTELKRRNRTWTAFIDTDEHVVYNSANIPLDTGLSVYHLLRLVQRHNVTNGTSQFESPCLTILRVQYGSVESPDEHVRRGVPRFLDPYRFQTLRYRHSERRKYLGKAIADVSRIDFEHSEMSAHRLVVQQCDVPWGQQQDLLRINHYIGSWEAYQRNGDRRIGENRTQKWHTTASLAWKEPGVPGGDEARGWIREFVDRFGEQRSRQLLDGVGFPYNETTALQPRRSPPCGRNCVAQYNPKNSIYAMVQRKLVSSQTVQKNNDAEVLSQRTDNSEARPAVSNASVAS